MALFFAGYGGFTLAQTTVGFHCFIERGLGRVILEGPQWVLGLVALAVLLVCTALGLEVLA